MPELPEVETVKRILESQISVRTITQVNILNNKSFAGDFHQILGQKIIGFSRLGKQLSIHLANNLILLFHLKMTGQLVYYPALSREGSGEGFVMGHPTKTTKSTRVILFFDNHSKLFFNDQRKFGWIKILTPPELVEFQKKVGIDILDPRFTQKYFHSQLQKTSRAIKSVLLDQEKFAGIGNIYANDALFLAGIHPQTSANKISLSKTKKLHQSIVDIINESISHGGSTAKDNKYIHPDGSFGSHQYHFRVYQRAGESCHHCSGPIQRLKIGGRGTFFCPDCQPIPK